MNGEPRRPSTLWPVLRKEFIQMRRDRFTLGMMIGIPAIQILLFGFAIRTEVRHLPTLVLDESATAESRELVQAMVNTRNFDLIGSAASRDEVRHRVERGDAAAAIVIPPDYARNLKRGRTASAQVVIDAADPLASSAAIGAASLAAASQVEARMARAGLRPPIDVRVRPWYNPALESSIFIVPGVIGVLLTMTLMLITAMAIVRERERGTLEQLIVTPITRAGLMLGKTLPFVLVGYVQVTVILLIGYFIFHVPVRGSLALLYAEAGLFMLASLALGLVISTMVQTQVQAMQLSFLVIMPTILLSGFMFPREAMPAVAQWIGAIFPITYFLRILRVLLLKGGGFDAVWRDTAVLAAVAVVLFTMAATRFQKTLD